MSTRRRRWTSGMLALGALAFLAAPTARADMFVWNSRFVAQPHPAPSAAPPAGGTVFAGETLPGATRISDGSADGRALGRLTRASANTNLPAGVYQMTVRLKATSTATRADLLSGDAMAASYGLTTTWTTVSGRVAIGSDKHVGIGSWVRSGTLPTIDVDWIHLVSAPAGLTTLGTSIVLPNGTPYQPSGFNKGDYQDSHVVNGRLQFSRNEANEIWAWGASTVRMGLSQEFWLADCASWAGTTATTYRTMIDNELQALTAKGVYVVLSLVSTDRGVNTGCTVTDGMLREMADQRSVTFWQAVASKYKANDHVIFDLFNEPHDIDANTWRNGGTVSYGGGTIPKSFTAVGMQTLYNTVRGTGATNLVMVSGLNWASDPRVHLNMPLDGYGIVAGAHSYCQDCAIDDPHPDPMLETLLSSAILGRMPVTLTETGWPNATSAKFTRTMVNWADSHSVGWLAYSWLAGSTGGKPDVFSIVGTPYNRNVGGVMTRSPMASGVPVWNELSSVRAARGLPTMDIPES